MPRITSNLGRVFVIMAPDEAQKWANILMQDPSTIDSAYLLSEQATLTGIQSTSG